MPFQFDPVAAIPGLVVVKPKRFDDRRGWFQEAFKASDFAAAGLPDRFLQHNHSRSHHAVLRGLHFQDEPVPQGKLVRCTRGEVFDVGVDIRKGSPTYRRWHGVRLSEENGLLFWVPPGFAHGFLTLSKEADVEYFVTSEYRPDLERTVRWNDPDLGVAWPLPTPVLGDRDAAAPPLSQVPHAFRWNAPSTARKP